MGGESLILFIIKDNTDKSSSRSHRKNGRNDLGIRMEESKNQFRKMEICLILAVFFQSR